MVGVGELPLLARLPLSKTAAVHAVQPPTNASGTATRRPQSPCLLTGTIGPHWAALDWSVNDGSAVAIPVSFPGSPLGLAYQPATAGGASGTLTMVQP